MLTNAARIVADTMQFAAEQRWHLTDSCVIDLITSPARAAYDLLNAYALFKIPSIRPCDSCQFDKSTPFLISILLNFTPKFQAIVVAVTRPWR
jgi:hypothetical protein